MQEWLKRQGDCRTRSGARAVLETWRIPIMPSADPGMPEWKTPIATGDTKAVQFPVAAGITVAVIMGAAAADMVAAAEGRALPQMTDDR